LLTALLPGREAPTQPAAPRLDRHGDPLPAGALHRLGRAERLRQHGTVASIALSPDGKVLASAGSQGIVCLWQLPSGKELGVLTGHAGPVHCVAFSTDGTLLASAGQDQTVRIYEAATGKLHQRLYNTAGVPQTLAFSPDGRLLAVGGTYHVRALRVWNVRTGLEVDQSYFDHEPVSAVAFAPDGKTVASAVSAGPGAGKLLLWETASGKQLYRQPTGRGPHVSLRFSQDGKTVFVAGGSGVVEVRDAATGQAVRQLQAHEGGLLALALSGDGTRLATSGRDEVKLWDPARGEVLQRYPAAEEDSAVGVALSRDGKVLATGSYGGRLRCWEVGSPRPNPPANEQTPVLGVAVAPDGRSVATLEREVIRLWDLGSGRARRTLTAEKEWFRCATYDPSGRRLATGGRTTGAGRKEGQLRLWDAGSGKPLWVETIPGTGVFSVAFAPNGKTVVALSSHRNVSVRDAVTGKELRHLLLELSVADLLALSPDGRLLACGSAAMPGQVVVGQPLSRGAVEIWDLGTGTKVTKFTPTRERLVALAFSPDGRALATVHSDEEVCLWEIATSRERLRLRRDRRRTTERRGLPGLAFSADGRLLAVSAADLGVRLWDTARAADLGELRGHRDAVCTLAIAADGSSLVSGSWDTTALVWDMKERQKRLSRPERLSEAAAERAWGTLTAPNPDVAHAALWALVLSPQQALEFCKKYLRPAQASGRSIEAMIADLDSPRYPVRQKATAELARLGKRARPALVQALAGNPTLEMKRRAQGLLDKLGRQEPHPEDLRAMRAVEILEHIGSAEARRFLETLARGSAEALLTLEARAALERLAGRR
jgi:WD40 repeat protein